MVRHSPERTVDTSRSCGSHIAVDCGGVAAGSARSRCRRSFRRPAPVLVEAARGGCAPQPPSPPVEGTGPSRLCAEEAAGVDRSAPNRSFPDENHKPELIAALTPFEALVGFRDATKTATFLAELGLSETPGFDGCIPPFLNDGPRAAFSAIVEPRGSGLDELDLAEMSVSLGEAAGVYDGAWAAEAQLLERLDRSHTGAPGVVAAALLNRVLLEPGEALFLDAGVLHAYIGGLAVEVMANSDNVLRGGLTSKHIDVSNLLDVLRPESVDPEPLTVDTSGCYRPSASEFVLSRLEKPERREVGGPAIVVAVYEDAVARNGSHQIRLAPTEAVWLAHGERAEISSDGLVFAATVGPQLHSIRAEQTLPTASGPQPPTSHHAYGACAQGEFTS